MEQEIPQDDTLISFAYASETKKNVEDANKSSYQRFEDWLWENNHDYY